MGPTVSLHMRGHGEYRLRATVRCRQARFPGSPSASRPSVPWLPRPDGRILAEPWKSTHSNGLRKAGVTTRVAKKVKVWKVFGGVGRHKCVVRTTTGFQKHIHKPGSPGSRFERKARVTHGDTRTAGTAAICTSVLWCLTVRVAPTAPRQASGPRCPGWPGL